MEMATTVRLVIFDCDGVLTDGGLWYGPRGPNSLRFDTRDGHGHQLLREAAIQVGWISGNNWPAARERARKLEVTLLSLGSADKSVAVTSLASRASIALGQVAFVGNDVNDLPAMALVGLPIAVADADWEVRARAAYVTKARGGHGAAREVADLILAAKRLG